MSITVPKTGYWEGWWRSLGRGLQTLLMSLAVISVVLMGYLGVTRYYNWKMKRMVVVASDGSQWEVRYPLYIYVGQTRSLEIQRIIEETTSPVAPAPTSQVIETPSATTAGAPVRATPVALTVTIHPPFLRFLGDARMIQEEEVVNVPLPPQALLAEVWLQNEGLADSVFRRVTLEIKTKDKILSSMSIWVEGPVGALFRGVAQAIFPFLFSAGVVGSLFSNLHHYQKVSERQQALSTFENLRAGLRIQSKFPDDFEQQAKRLSPYETLLPADEYRCLTALNEIYQRWRWRKTTQGDPLEKERQFVKTCSRPSPERQRPSTAPLEKERQFVKTCSLEWVEALLLLWETYWLADLESTSDRPEGLESASDIPWDQYRLLLRQLPRFKFSDEGAQRIKRLLQRTGAPQVQPPTYWPPKADQRCIPHFRSRTFDKPSSLFPEGEALDARLSATQAWLFGKRYGLFWEHPLFKTWWREPADAQASSQKVRLIVGAPGSGRTTLALAAGRYLHGDERLGVYVDNPRHLQDVQRALARRLLTFLCARAPDVWRLERGLREALLHLWLGVWPKAVVRARLETSLENWDDGPGKYSKPMTSLHVAELARVELQTWLRMLGAFEQPTPLSPEAWWQLAAEVAPALGREVQDQFRGWNALWIAVDFNDVRAARALDVDSWQQTVVPLARQIPTTWFVFQSATAVHPLDQALFYEAITWSVEDLARMLEHRQARLGYSPWNWPEQKQLQVILAQASTPRTLGRLWFARERVKLPGAAFAFA